MPHHHAIYDIVDIATHTRLAMLRYDAERMLTIDNKPHAVGSHIEIMVAVQGMIEEGFAHGLTIDCHRAIGIYEVGIVQI